MATGINANRVVFEIDDTLYDALMAAVEERSSNVRRATVAEVLRGLIADHLVPARISSGKK